MGQKTKFVENTDTLKDIEKTSEGTKKPTEVTFIEDEETAKVLAEPVRLQILQILRRGIDDEQTTEEYNEETNERIIRKRMVKRNILSVVEMVKMSECETCGFDTPITKNQVYHHLPKLIETGYVVKYGTVTKGNRTTDYYRRTSAGFVITTWLGEVDEEIIEKKSRENIGSIVQVFDFDVTEEQQKKLIALVKKSHRLEMDWRGKIARKVRGDVANSEVLYLYDWLISLCAIGSQEYLDVMDKIRTILFPEGL